MKKMINSFVVLVLVISSQKHYSKVFILQFWKKCLIERYIVY